MSRPATYKLPELLSQLPRFGRASLVRPASWPTNSFYKVTRSQIKFRPAPNASSSTSNSSTLSSDDAVIGDLKAGGKAWGMLFWKGKLVPPQSKSAAADPRIRGGLKHRWLTVDRQSLDTETQAALDESDTILRSIREQRFLEVTARRAAKRERRSTSAGTTDE